MSPVGAGAHARPHPGRMLAGAVVGAALARQIVPDAPSAAGVAGALGGAVLASGPCLAPPGVLTWWSAGLGAWGARAAARPGSRATDLAAGLLTGAILGRSLELSCQP